MCRSLKSNVQANGLYKRPQLLHLQLDTYNEGGVVMTSAQVAEQIKSIFPLFYIQGRSSRVIIDLRCSSFFIMQTDMLYTKKRKSLNYWNSRTYNLIFLFSAERQGFEPRVPRSTTVFKTAAIDHSATSPELRLSSAFLLKRCKGTNHFLTCKLFRKKILEKYFWK